MTQEAQLANLLRKILKSDCYMNFVGSISGNDEVLIIDGRVDHLTNDEVQLIREIWKEI